MLGRGGGRRDQRGLSPDLRGREALAQPAQDSPPLGGQEVGPGRRGSAGSQGLGSGSCSPGRGREAGPGQPWGAEWVSGWVFTQWRYGGTAGHSRLEPRKG